MLWTNSFSTLRLAWNSSGVFFWWGRHTSIKNYWRGKVPDLQLLWMAIRRPIYVVSYAPSGLWSVRVQESKKMLMEASVVIGEVQRYLGAMYARMLVNLPPFERLVRAHIPRYVPDEWRSVQDYPPQNLIGRRSAGPCGQQGTRIPLGRDSPYCGAACAGTRAPSTSLPSHPLWCGSRGVVA